MSKRPFGAFLFNLNIVMHIQSENDFKELRNQLDSWRLRFPMFTHDVSKIDRAIEEHIKQYSIALMHHRQTHKKQYLEYAQQEIDEINRIINTVEQLELMAMLSR